MAILQTDKSKFLTMMVIIILGLFSLTLFAQEKEESKSKVSQLKGKVEKITVKVDGKDVVFEGEEAQKMADKMKSEKHIKIMSSGNLKEIEEGDGNVMIFRSKANAGDFDIKSDGEKKKVKVEVNDGKKVVTITTMKDGKEETKTYEGEDAEKFLKDEQGAVKVWVTKDDKEGEDHMIYCNRKTGGRGKSKHGGNRCCGRGCGMEMAPKHGGTPHKMMMKMKMDDDGDVKVVEGKKLGKIVEGRKLEEKDLKKIEKK